MENITKVAIILIVVFVTIGCSDSENITIDKEKFVGDWSVIMANKDGVLQDNWNGLVVEIEQQDDFGGNYRLSESPDTLIWSKRGSWIKSGTPYLFKRDNELDVVFDFKDEELYLSFLIVSGSNCEEEPCVLSVKGHWSFVLKKK